MKRSLYITLVLVGLLLLAIQLRATSSGGEPVTINKITVPPVPTLDPDKIVLGEALYAQHCAACHGPNLEGDPNWKTPLPDGSLLPPPHDGRGHTWHHSDALLIEIFKTEKGVDKCKNKIKKVHRGRGV